ncbi:MAG: DUF1015 domain-containing protein [Planctomycetota bacterium]|nr:DUF1015 domain-containing protein [Planctomycetota bacterium]
MARIHAFRGIRYNLGQVGALSDVIAPPYDVIDPALQAELYDQHPLNVIRLILNRAEPGDDKLQNQYTRAAATLRRWQREGVLQTDPDPAIYVYHQVYTHGGESFTRRGFMARVSLEKLGSGSIYPHEETHAAAKADRLQLTRACQANLSQIFSVYPDPDNVVQQGLEAAIATQAPLEAVDHLGITHRIWPVTDLAVIQQVATDIATLPLFIADGHHRYETACNFLAERKQQGPLAATDPANGVLMMCVSMNDPGMIVLPTHRLFRGVPEMSSPELQSRLADCFTIRPAGAGPDQATTVWEGIESADRQEMLGLYTASDQQWVLATLTDSGRQKMAGISPHQSRSWQGLGVSILHRLVIETLLEIESHPKPHYVHRVDEVIEGLQRGSDQGEHFPLAALVMPASLEHIRSISREGERMPAKSTYFFPKLVSGLVFHSLTQS